MNDGTFIHTGASENNVNAHGRWPLSNATVNTYFRTGMLDLFADTLEIIEMSKDGMSWKDEAVTELRLLDGTVIYVTSFTVHATRMTLDSDLAPPGRRDD